MICRIPTVEIVDPVVLDFSDSRVIDCLQSLRLPISCSVNEQQTLYKDVLLQLCCISTHQIFVTGHILLSISSGSLFASGASLQKCLIWSLESASAILFFFVLTNFALMLLL